MTKKEKNIQKNKKRELMIINPDAAGIDVASTEHQVCVPEDRDENHNRQFGCFTSDLHVIAKWLKKCMIKTVAMESTGIYWVQLFLILQDYGFEVLLVNAGHIKNINGKKTDVVDASWIQLLHSYGLLKPSFQTDNLTKELRSLMRQRDHLVRDAAREIQHMQKALELMNIKVHKVISDLLSVSGMKIVKAIIDGERDPIKLAENADRRIKATKEEIIKSLEGIWSKDQIFILRKSFDYYQFIQSQIIEYDNEINNLANKYHKGDNKQGLIKSGKPKGKKNDLNFDSEQLLYETFNVNVTRIPGLGYLSSMKLLSELGPDFTDKFEDKKNFCSWCNVTPNNKISGGKIISSKVPKRKSKVGQIFRVAANTLKHSKSPLGDFFRRIQARHGYNQAIVATANKIAGIFYTMVKEKKEYDETFLIKDKKEHLNKRKHWLEKQLKTLENQITHYSDCEVSAELVI